MSSNTSILLLTSQGHLGLAKKIGKCEELLIERFPDGEIGVRVLSDVRGKNVVLMLSMRGDPNLYLIELLVAIDALVRAGARDITAALPYFPYARQDRKSDGSSAITAKLIADLLQTAGVTRVITVDLHREQIEGFFAIPVENLSAKALFVKAAMRLGLEGGVVVAPDIGRANFARSIACDLGADLALVDKRRCGTVLQGVLLGEIDGRDVFLVDDICSTGGTLRQAAALCKEHGARRVIAAVTHLLPFCNPCEGGDIERLLTTDTLPQEGQGDIIEILSVAELLAGSIYETNSKETVGSF